MKILFVCSGNMCRSPMADGIARKMLRGQANVESAGTNAMSGSPASDRAIEVMRKSFGIDISSHRSLNVRMMNASIDDFDYIIAMDDTVAGHLRCIYPSISSKLIQWNVPDPFGGDLSAYERCAREIWKRIEGFLASIHMPVE
jgi:ribose 5-phosphate isomerase B